MPPPRKEQPMSRHMRRSRREKREYLFSRIHLERLETRLAPGDVLLQNLFPIVAASTSAVLETSQQTNATREIIPSFAVDAAPSPTRIAAAPRQAMQSAPYRAVS